MQALRPFARRLIPYAVSGAGFIALLVAALQTPALIMAPLHVVALSHALVIDHALMVVGVGAGGIELWLILTYVVLAVPFIMLAETLPRFSSSRRWPRAIAAWVALFALLTALALILGAAGVVVE